MEGLFVCGVLLCEGCLCFCVCLWEGCFGDVLVCLCGGGACVFVCLGQYVCVGEDVCVGVFGGCFVAVCVFLVFFDMLFSFAIYFWFVCFNLFA